MNCEGNLGFNGRRVFGIIIVLLALLSCSYLVSALENNIDLVFDYNSGSLWDTDDDGFEIIGGVIDFSVGGTTFNWEVDNSKLCTKWGVYSIENEESTLLCYGSNVCCGLIDLIPQRAYWDEPFYLNFGDYGATFNNIVSAQVIYVDYSLDTVNPYSEVYYSDWIGLTAYFYQSSFSMSSFITQDNISINITSPDNSTFLTSGKNLSINFTTNVNVTANYSIDSLDSFSLGSNKTQFGALIEQELTNGQHIINIFVQDLLGNTASFNHIFFVNDTPIINDTVAPVIDLLYPVDNQIIHNTSVLFRYMAIDDHDMECSLSICVKMGDWWCSEKSSISGIKSNTEQTLLLEDFNDNDYKWKVECTDSFGNKGSSEEDFTIENVIQNNLVVTINSNMTTINEGQPISFSALVSGSTGSVTYKWDFNNDKTVDSTLPSPIYTFTKNGTYIVNLSVKDSLWNTTLTKSITVLKYHNISFILKDNKTNGAISNAEVTFDSVVKNTSSSGTVVFEVSNGNYNVEVRKPGYFSYSQDMGVNSDSNRSFNFYLLESDEDVPVIDLLSPLNDELLTDSFVDFVFRVSDKSKTTCRLYANLDSSWLKVQDAIYGINNDSENIFELSGLENGSYNWKIECTDIFGNSNGSDTYGFTINTPTGEEIEFEVMEANLIEQDEEAEDIISQIASVLGNINGLGLDEKEAAEDLDLIKSLEKARITIERANRDLHNLKWRRLNDTELEKVEQEILDKINEVKDTTIKKFSVVESAEFVSYPTEEDIKNTAELFLEVNKIKLRKKQEQAFIENIEELQSLLTVTTRSKIIDVEYISGKQERITLVNKQFKSNKNVSDIVLWEVIPKDVAEDVADIEMLFDYEIIEGDPVIEISLEGLSHITYFLHTEIDLDKIEGTRSVLIPVDYDFTGKSMITGFTIFNTTMIKEIDPILAVEILVILILILVYIGYSFRDISLIKKIFNKKDLKIRKELNEKVSKISDHLNEGAYEKSRLLYQELYKSFKDLPLDIKKEMYPKIVSAGHKVDVFYINNLVKEANKSIEGKHKGNASKIYNQINIIYKKISKQYKSEVLKICIDLNKKISQL